MQNDNGAVAVLGASKKSNRYSNKAVRMLSESGYSVVPVHPQHREVEGFEVVPDLDSIQKDIHTLSLYVNPKQLEHHVESIIRLKPGRVIMNPGTESEEVKRKLEEKGVPVIEACTLVLLRTGQFEKDLKFEIS